MHISFSPVRLDLPLSLEKAGDRLTINGEAFDFTDVPEGGTLPVDAVECEFLASDVERIDGIIHLTLILPHGQDAAETARFPDPIHAEDGVIQLPMGAK